MFYQLSYSPSLKSTVYKFSLGATCPRREDKREEELIGGKVGPWVGAGYQGRSLDSGLLGRSRD